MSGPRAVPKDLGDLAGCGAEEPGTGQDSTKLGWCHIQDREQLELLIEGLIRQERRIQLSLERAQNGESLWYSSPAMRETIRKEGGSPWSTLSNDDRGHRSGGCLRYFIIAETKYPTPTS